MAVEPSQWQEENEEDGQDRDVRFDPMAHYQSRQAEPRSVRRLPGLVAAAMRLAHEASPRLFALVGALQLAAVVVIALQVLIGKLAIEHILGVATDTQSLSAAILPLVGLVAATARPLSSALVGQLQRLLGERVPRLSWIASST